MEDLVAYYDDNYILKSLIHIDIDNLGFTRGYGVYECFRSYEGFSFKIKDHVNRLKKNCEKMLIKFPKVDIEAIIKNLIQKNGEKNLIFRLYVIDHPNEEKSLLTILCNTESFFKNSHPNRAISVQPHIDKRKDILIKSTGYLESMIALKKAKKNGFDEVLYIGEDNYIRELSRANFFAIKDNTLYSPKSQFLEGITRKYTIELAKKLGFKIKYENIPIKTIGEFDEVFCTASIRGIRPIKQIANISFPTFSKTLFLKNSFKSHFCSDNQNEKNLSFSH